MIEFVFPWALVLLPAPWLVWRFLPPYRQQVPALRFPFFRHIVDAAGTEARAGSVVMQRRKLQMIVALLAWGLMVVALARPERVGEPVEITNAARDIILAIDISGSMEQNDFTTADGNRIQRLAAVKNVVGDFVEAREGDRVALIVFGSKAVVQSPFTEDLRIVRELLEQTEVGMAGPHTVIGDAIGLSIRTFEASEIQQRLLILLSDGADTGSRMTPINAAEIAASNRVAIYTIGVGDPDGSGEQRVDPDALKDIASRAGGEFFFADDETALQQIYARIDELTPRKVETTSFRQRHALTWWPLSIALILIIATMTLLQLQARRGVTA